MVDTKRFCFFCWALIFSFVSFCLMCVSLSTNFWIESRPQKNSTLLGSKKVGNGTVHFGLFRGSKVFDSGFGTKDRDSPVSVVDYSREEGVLPFGLWVGVVVFAFIAVVLIVASAALCLLNLLSKPFRTEQGPLAICIINAFSILSTLLCVALFCAIFFSHLSDNVLTQAEKNKDWVSTGRTRLEWSFWLVPLSGASQALTLLIVVFSSTELANCRCCHRNAAQGEIVMHDVMIY